ncbi:hypothetical protein CALVIDRAFT_534207 [Calocera viscosa TUFC12733]|uniref:Zn(2)-C6 fungal-type domain-containing protein n=1 Tax=Calocera viscosa (strain TUFC12733) TaxID=1330018 RepID=A0A167QI61_CALVF|nr:hypothetical protein CALVIDRAFT_534207 [Calocera viscosa TUFC12733]
MAFYPEEQDDPPAIQPAAVAYQPYTPIFWNAPRTSVQHQGIPPLDEDAHRTVMGDGGGQMTYYDNGLPNPLTYEPMLDTSLPYQVPSQLAFPGTFMMTPPGSLSPPVQSSPTCRNPSARHPPAAYLPIGDYAVSGNPSPTALAYHSPTQFSEGFIPPMPAYGYSTNPDVTSVQHVFRSVPRPIIDPQSVVDMPTLSGEPFQPLTIQQPYSPATPYEEPSSSLNERYTSNRFNAEQDSPSPIAQDNEEQVQYHTPPLSESVEDSEEESDPRRLYGMQCRKKNGHPHVACYHCKHRKMKCDGKVYDRDGRPWCEPCIERRGPCYWPATYHRYMMEDHAQAVARVQATLQGNPATYESLPDRFDPNKCFERASWSWCYNPETGKNQFDENPQDEGRKRRRRSRLYNWWDVFSAPESSLVATGAAH